MLRAFVTPAAILIAASLCLSGRAAAEEPAPAAPPSTVVRGLSWDILAGGVPTSGALLQVEAGFSGLPRVSYHHTLRQGLSVGGQVGFDYGYYRAQKGFYESLVFAVPVRFTVHRDSEWSVGLSAAPGLSLGIFDGLDVGLVANLSGAVGYTVEHRIIVGGGVELPLMLNIPTHNRRSTALIVPILVGPMVEFHVTPPFALTVDVKLGPHLSTSAGANLGLKMMLGAAYRL